MKYEELYPATGSDYKRKKLKKAFESVFGPKHKGIDNIGVRRDGKTTLLSAFDLDISLSQIMKIRALVNFDFVLEDVRNFTADFGSIKKDQIISSFGYFPLYSVTLTVRNCPSLHNIHKHVKQIRDYFHIENMATTHLLGILLIQGPFRVSCLGPWAAILIINKYLTSNRDINACQEELIEAGFTEQAKL